MDMKKLFTFSMLSMLAVMGVAQAELAGKGFVTAGRINQELYGFTKNESVVRSTGQVFNGITDISGEVEESPDSYIPTVGMVEANFVPNEAVDYYNGAMWGNSTTMQEPGAYLLMVIVDENGNKSYRWVATQIGLYDTSAGQIAG